MSEQQRFLPLVLPEAVRPSRRELHIPASISWEEFEVAARFVWECVDAAAFWQADVLRRGREIFGDARLAKLFEELSVPRVTLGQAQRLAGVEVECRREGLPMEAHLKVGKLAKEEQLHWLSIAEESKLSPAELARSIRVGSVVREANGDTGDRGRSSFKFARIEGIVAEFKLWWRNVSEQGKVNGEEVEWLGYVVSLTEEMMGSLERLRRLLGIDGFVSPMVAVPAVGAPVLLQVSTTDDPEDVGFFVGHWTGEVWVAHLPSGNLVDVKRPVMGWREVL